jgi:hypothetical protein
LSPQIEQSFSNTPIGARARKKRLLGFGQGVQRGEQSKNSKVLEASNLRAFNKIYIISNQQFINLNAVLMYCFELGNARTTETGAAEETDGIRNKRESNNTGTGDA